MTIHQGLRTRIEPRAVADAVTDFRHTEGGVALGDALAPSWSGSPPSNPKPAACTGLDTGCPRPSRPCPTLAPSQTPEPGGPRPHRPEGQGPDLQPKHPLWAPEALQPPGTNMGVHGHAVQPESLLRTIQTRPLPLQNSPRTKLILPLLGHISEKSFHKASVTVRNGRKLPLRGGQLRHRG